MVRAVKKEEVQTDQFIPLNTEDTQIKRIYRVPGRLLPALKEELEVMKSLGVIERSQSEWSNPIALVLKKYCSDSVLTFKN